MTNKQIEKLSRAATDVWLGTNSFRDTAKFLGLTLKEVIHLVKGNPDSAVKLFRKKKTEDYPQFNFAEV